ncbi:hypothetical protein F511_14817 [Dorcoceras hygrometricum]|uniref:Uncharacterized protein n=1 Tax=Dorcoceras hygrometricum TaxID=472368 RepID=A0A2Z7D999_9LAMI|nr:hypothetical protein F511_14817 [Dorcoceras hygrometricum]
MSKLCRDTLATVHRTLSSPIADGRQLRLKREWIMKRRRLERSGSACNISRCLSVDLYRVGYAEADVNAGQHTCSARKNVVVWLALRNQSMRIFDFQTSTLVNAPVACGCFWKDFTRENQPMVLGDQLVADLMTCSPYWGLTPCPSGAWFVFLACCVVQVTQLVVELAQLEVPQEVVRVSQ